MHQWAIKSIWIMYSLVATYDVMYTPINSHGVLLMKYLEYIVQASRKGNNIFVVFLFEHERERFVPKNNWVVLELCSVYRKKWQLSGQSQTSLCTILFSASPKTFYVLHVVLPIKAEQKKKKKINVNLASSKQTVKEWFHYHTKETINSWNKSS